MFTPANRSVPALDGGLLGAHVLLGLGAALDALALALEEPGALVGAVVGTDVTGGLVGVIAIGELDADEAGRHWK